MALSPSALSAVLVTAVVSWGCGSGCQQLQTDTVPRKYSLHLSVSMHPPYNYTGVVRMDLEMNNTDRFWLDCDAALEVISTDMVFDREWPVVHSFSRVGDRLTVITSTLMRPSYRVQFQMTFAAAISTRHLDGFYLSQYRFNQTLRTLASTQFQSSAARKAFPCFDQPAFRSNFSLQISVDSRFKAISNTPVLSDQVSGAVRTVRFREKSSLPVYLVGWLVYEEESFGWRGLSGGAGPVYRVWANRAHFSGTAPPLALQAAPVILRQLDHFTGIVGKAVVDKLDLVGVPDFSAGAMENWGMITFRESALLEDNEWSTLEDVRQILMTVAHELSHQWFGNLVTPASWSYTWLSEGFARYLQYFIMHQIFPMMRLDELFILNSQLLALQQDGPSSHPLTKENLTSQDDISDMFDVITYDKGAAVIHMIKSILGETEFRKGIQSYLTKVDSSGGVATPQDLFSSFPALAEDMKLWTETSGYPVLVIEESEKEGGIIIISQVKVTAWNQTQPGTWLVPVTINMCSNLSTYYLQPNNTLEIPLCKNREYFLNVNKTGYYRVLYKKAEAWLAGGGRLERAALVSDSLALAACGLLPYSSALATATHHLTASHDYLVLTTFLKAAALIQPPVEGTHLQPFFTDLMLELTGEGIEYIWGNQSITLDGNRGNDSYSFLYQVTVLQEACHHGHQRCLQAAQQMSTEISGTSPEQRRFVLCLMIKEGNRTLWETVWGQYVAARTPAERQFMLRLLTCTRDSQLIKKLLNEMWGPNFRRHDILSTIALISKNRIGAEETYTYVITNYRRITDYFGEFRSLRRILSSVIPYMNESHVAELKRFSLRTPQLELEAIIKDVDRSIIWKTNVRRELMKLMEKEDTSPPACGNNSGSVPGHPVSLICLSVFLAVLTTT